MRTVAVIDGNSLMHRAYHAVQAPMNTADGTPTNAVFGFMSMLLKFIDNSHPDAIVCAFDAGKPKFRIEALEQYKAQRKHMDDALRVQFPLAENLLEAMNIPVIKVPGWEGDDILGTVAARNEANNDKTLLVTGDKDACQLVTDKTFVVNTKKGISEVVIYDPQGVKDKYGVSPAQIPDFLGLMGDSSDNIPGVTGVGAKTATRLLQKYGSMEGLYEHTSELKGKMQENIINCKDIAFLSKKIATIVCDLDFELDLASTKFPNFDVEKVSAAFNALQFSKHLKRVLALQGESAGTGFASGAAGVGDAAGATGFGSVGGAASSSGYAVNAPKLSYHVTNNAESYIEHAIKSGETLAIGLSIEEDATLFPAEPALLISDGAGIASLSLSDSWAYIEKLLKSAKLSGFEIKHTLRTAAYACNKTGNDLRQLLAQPDLPERLFDCNVAAYVLNSSLSQENTNIIQHFLGLSYEAEKDKAKELGNFEVAAAYACKEVLEKELELKNQKELFSNIEMPLLPVLLQMELDGTYVDVKVLDNIKQKIAALIESSHKKIIEYAGEDFNVDSPKQLSVILFDKLMLDRRKSKKLKSGSYSTNATVLEKLQADHPIAENILKYRELTKLKNTYLEALPALISERDGRVHTSYNQTVTATGRLSSSDPNLQNIPVRTEAGRHIREAFAAAQGHKFVSADYSQIELRLLAHFSEDEKLIAAFKSGEDFHAHTAAQIFGVSLSEVTPEMRSRAKSVNFGIVYGQGAFGLGQNLHIPMKEAQAMIDRYYESYPQVRAFLDKTVDDATRNGFAQTMFGRRRYIAELAASNKQLQAFGQRSAMNHPMQGSAADIIKLAMCELQRRIIQENLDARMVLQVHDELDLECSEQDLERLLPLTKDVMENVVELRVPLCVDINYAKNWAQAH